MSEVSQLEAQRETAKDLIATRDKVVKLYDNPEFKELIVDGFCRIDCARFAQQGGDPNLSPSERTDALNMAMAAGHLRRYLSQAVQMGNTAARNMPDLDVAIEEARQEAGE